MGIFDFLNKKKPKEEKVEIKDKTDEKTMLLFKSYKARLDDIEQQCKDNGLNFIELAKQNNMPITIEEYSSFSPEERRNIVISSIYKFEKEIDKQITKKSQSQAIDDYIKINNTLADQHKKITEAFQTEEMKDYLVRAVENYEELSKKIEEDEKQELAIKIAEKLKDDPKFKENSKNYKSSTLFVIDIINQMSEIYQKQSSKEENYKDFDPTNKVKIELYCRMPEARRIKIFWKNLYDDSDLKINRKNMHKLAKEYFETSPEEIKRLSGITEHKDNSYILSQLYKERKKREDFSKYLLKTLETNQKFQFNSRNYENKDKFIYETIVDLAEIYNKTRDEAYNPEDITTIKMFCLMDEEERKQNLSEALGTGRGSRGLN